jgi:predicted RNA-binding protein YlxR (DUF448 family)
MTLEAKRIPERMCVACREVFGRDRLFRFVKLPEGGVITRNDKGRQPGKGLYICRDRECWDRLFSRRNLKRTIAQRIDAESVAWVEQTLGGKG